MPAHPRRVGYPAAEQRYQARHDRLLDHVEAAMAERPGTMAGVIIQAQPLEAVAFIGRL